MGKSLKSHKSLNEQLDLLKNRNLVVEDEEKAVTILSNINYYRLSGYLNYFKNKDDKYENVSFSKLIRIYEFDCKLTRVLMYALENVEETFKTKFSYTLSSLFPKDPEIYLDRNIYKREKDFDYFVKLFNKAKIDNSGLPFIKHHDNRYDGKLPIWVAVEIMTMGNLQALYKNLKTQYQKNIADLYNTGPKQMTSWLENITFTRNHLAHYMRIFRYNFGRIPMKCSKHCSFENNGKIFNQILLIGFMFSEKAEWDHYVVPEIKKLLDEYKNVLSLDDLGFPINWETILKL
jgi:abortive infection bacteriophage resistance protein